MNPRTWFVTLLLVAFMATFTPGAIPAADTKRGTSSDDVAREAQEALDTTKHYTIQQKEAFQKKMRDELDEIQKGINQLQAKTTRLSSEARAETEKAIRDLEKKKHEAMTQLSELQRAGATGWGKLKAGVHSTMEDLNESFKRARSSLP